MRAQRRGVVDVSDDDIDDVIDPGMPVQWHHFPGTTVTVCCIVLRNGFAVVGEAGCSTTGDFDPEVSARQALENAKDKVWGLVAFAKRGELRGKSADSEVVSLGF